MPEYSTRPAVQQQASDEDFTWACDLAALVADGEITNPSASLYDLSIRTPIALLDSIEIDITGYVLGQRIRAGMLTAGHSYVLNYLYTIGENTLTSELKLTCPS